MGTKVTKVITTAIDRVDSPFAMQRIEDVRATPGASRVIIQFNTLFATVPVIEVSRVDRQLPQVPNPVFAQFPIFGGLRQIHTIEFRELDSFTHYRFTIKAAGGPDGGVGIAQVFGDFFTGTRSGQILFDRLQIHQRGDRDMYFNIEIYDGTGANRILSRFLTGHRFLDRGQYDQPFPNVNLNFAPDSLRLSITGYNTDKSFPSGFGGFAHGPGPETLPSSVADGNRYADSEDAILTGIVQTMELGHFATNNTQTIPFVLSSINKRFGYSIEGRIIYQVKDHPKTIERARIAEIRKKAVKSAATMTVGQRPGGCCRRQGWAVADIRAWPRRHGLPPDPRHGIGSVFLGADRRRALRSVDGPGLGDHTGRSVRGRQERRPAACGPPEPARA